MPRDYDREGTWNALCFAEGADAENAAAALITKTVKDDSYRSYISTARRVLAFTENRILNVKSREAMLTALPVRTPEEVMKAVATQVTRDEYALFMSAYAMTKVISFKKVRAMLVMAQTMYDHDGWATSRWAKKVEKGALNAAKAKGLRPTTLPKGTVDGEMLQNLVNFVSIQNEEMAEAMQIQWGAALRIKELISLRPEDIVEDGIMLEDPKNLRAEARQSVQTPYLKKLIKKWPAGHDAWKRLRRWAAVTEPGHLIFERRFFTKKEYCFAIKQAALHFKWPKELNFNGSHVLRHGGVNNACITVAEACSATQLSTILRMSYGTICWYARSMQERVSMERIPAALARFGPQLPADNHDNDSDDDEETDTATLQRGSKRRHSTTAKRTAPKKWARRAKKNPAAKRTQKGRAQSEVTHFSFPSRESRMQNRRFWASTE